MATKRTNTWNDTPTLEGLLGRGAWRKAISKQIIEADPPKVLAVHSL